ncbi:MAG: glycosyltransferase [Paludibacteraceae bacterium]|nr:glycosyltransferase [Paludibacteraceae bacterium]
MDANNRKVSIITPLYNGSRFVAQTIESVIAQTYQDWEMIIINDGSNDNGPAICREYAAKDARIKVFDQPNGGSASARNNGIRRALGRYIALLDADDTWMPYFLESQLDFMRENEAVLVFGSHLRIDENGRECLRPFVVPEKVGYRDMLRTCYISCLTGLYDTKPFGKVFLHEEFRSLRDDYVYWLEIIKKCKVAYGNQRILGSYRILSSSISRDKKKVVIPQYRVYRHVEGFNVFVSLYYLICWAITGYKKYRK